MEYSISFILLNYKQASFVIRDVKALKALYPEASFVAVDNHSEDASYESMVKELGEDPIVRIVQDATNTGYAVGNNVGIREAIKSFDPEFLAIMNPDVIIEDKAIIPVIINAFRNDSALALCTGLMLDDQKRLNPKAIAWKVPDKLDYCLLNLPLFRLQDRC